MIHIRPVSLVIIPSACALPARRSSSSVNMSSALTERHSEGDKQKGREKTNTRKVQKEAEARLVYQDVRHGVGAGARCDSSAGLAGRTHACHPPFCLGPLHAETHTHTWGRTDVRTHASTHTRSRDENTHSRTSGCGDV